MRCETIMKRDVECVSPEATVQQAAERMRSEEIGFLPVCDESFVALGTLTDRDLAIRVLAEGRDANTRVAEVFTHEVVACSPEDDLRKAEDLMGRYQKSRIMCIDGEKRLVGVISLSDIAQRERGTRAAQTLAQVAAREARA